MTLLASAALSLKIWDFSEKGLLLRNTFESKEGDETHLSWNHTNQVLAVSGSARKINLIHSQNGQLLSTIPFVENRDSIEHIDEEISSISFSPNSRYIANGAGSLLCIWDLKRRNLKFKLNGHQSSITSLSFLSDSDIVCGDLKGSIRIWDIKTGISSKEGIIENKSSSSDNNLYLPSVTCVKVAPLGIPRIAVGYSNGYLSLWDPIILKEIRHQSIHNSPLMALSYSPKNVRLVATAGYDGKMSLVDTGSKTASDPSASIDIGERLTAVSFHENAVHCAVGTDTGRVLIYDWRNIRKPIFTTHHSLHSSPITGLEFQNPLATSSTRPQLGSSTPSAKASAPPSPLPSASSSPTATPPRASPLPRSNRISSSYGDCPATPPREPDRGQLQRRSAEEQRQAPARDTAPAPALEAPSGVGQEDASISSDTAASSRAATSAAPALAAAFAAPATTAPEQRLLTADDLQEALRGLRYDIHREVAAVLKEQSRQFAAAKEDTAELISALSRELKVVLAANEELRRENERLRHIY